MADKQRAYDTRNDANLFADDDPLAELARIVGFEPRVAANTVDAAPRQEPAFNLEDELLREFERYDAPTAPAVVDHPVETAYAQPEPVVYTEPEPVTYDEPEPRYEQAPRYEDAPRYEAEPVPYEAPVVSERVEGDSLPVFEQPDARAVLSSADWAATVARPAEPVSGGARDLIEELELSISAAPAPMQPAKAPQWSAASIRLPIANFHPARREEPAMAAPVAAPAPVVATVPVTAAPRREAAFEAPAAASFPAEIDRHEPALVVEQPVVEALVEPVVDHGAFDLAAAAKDGDVKADAALTEVAAEASNINFDIDDLLADVSQYPVVAREAAPVAVQPVAPAPVAPAPVAPVVSSPVAARAHIPAPPVAVAPVAAAPVAPRHVPEPQAVAAKAVPDAEDPFAGHDFELDLEGIELELADLDFVEPVAAEEIMQPKPQPAPAPMAYQPAVRQPEPAARTAPAPYQSSAAAPAYQAPVYQQAPAYQQASAPVYRSPEPAAPAAPSYRAPMRGADMTEELPFDPSMISDAEYQTEAVEMHVPTLPPVEKHEPVPAMSDFDFDVDSEIANLLAPAKQVDAPARPAQDMRVRSQAPVAMAASVAPPQPSQPQAQSFDEFERALEEDFRRSVNEPVQQRRDTVSEVQIQSASDAEDMNRARSMKRMLAAAAVIVIFGGVAYAGYSFLARDGGIGIGTGEPPVIVADKDPVKVVPENPGGKTVPNQDKAVYDSVGGAAAEAPKQKSLVSSDEQPVDVVQRTLTPETLPEDNDAPMPSMSTPVGDTQDPRLLPNNDATDTAAANPSDADRSPSVSARKVRTMIVRPDGTLVARDEPAPEPTTPSLPKPTSVQTQKITAGAASSDAPTIEQLASADIRSTPVEGTTPTAKQASENVLAKAASASPDNVSPPVRAVTSTKSDTAPASRPGAAALAPATAAAQAPKEVAAVPPAAAQAQPSAAAPGSYGVQIASLPSEAEAQKSYASLSKKFGGVLSGMPYEIRKAEVAGKGTYYRLRITAGSKDEAATICEKYRAAGGSCLISK